MPKTLTTESVPPHRRADYWEEMVSQQFVAARCCVPVARSPFSAAIRSLELDFLKLSDVRSEGTDVLRTNEHIARAETNYFLLSLQVEGTGCLEHARRSVFLHPGDMVLYDTARSYQLRFAAAQQQLVLRIPRNELIARCPNIECFVGISIPDVLPAARLARDLVRNVAALDSLPSIRAQSSLASTITDLVLDSLLELNTQRSTRACSLRLTDAKRVAQRYLADPSFSVARWADAMGISERYLRLLFGSSTQSPGQYLWGQRLERAAMELRTPTSLRRSITDIAFGCGFSDSAHFSRSFRVAYGMTPRDYRSSDWPNDT
jgi:AraC-like DNA-binding protein